MNRGCVVFGVLLAASLVAQDATQAPERSLRIRARVLDTAGRPLTKAGMVVGPADAVTTAAALGKSLVQCAPDGTLELAIARSPADDYSLAVLLLAAPGKVALRVPNFDLMQRATHRHGEFVLDLGEVRLPDGFTLSGKVRGRDGKALPGARIRAVDSLAIYPWLWPSFGSEGVTGADGVFVLPGVFANAMNVLVEAPGYYCRTFAALDLGQPLDVQLDESGFVEGTVHGADGEPFEGTVVATYEFLGAASPPVRAVQGRFRLGVTAPCRFKVLAHDPASGREAESALLSGPANGVEVHVGGATTKQFVVRAVDAKTGGTVAPIQASGFCFGGDLDSVEGTLAWSLRPSDVAGKVWLVPWMFAAGRAVKGVVHVTAAGYAPFFAQHVDCQEGGEYVAKLVNESRIEGRVVDAKTGKPEPGVEVTCERLREQGHRGSARPPAPTITAADGTFAFGGLGEGAHEVVARHRGGSAAVTARSTVAVGARREDLELRLPPGVTVTGRVAGAVPAGWKFVLAAENAAPSEDDWSAGDGALGAWNVEGAVPIVDSAFRCERRGAGTEQLSLVVPLPGRHGAALRIPVQDVRIGEADVAVEVDLAKHLPGTVAGKVTFAGAEFPRSRLAVVAAQICKDEQGWVGHTEQMRRRHWSLVGSDGTFEVPVAPGSYQLEAIDVATGVRLLLAADPVDVAPGKATTKDLRIETVAATVTFETEGKGRLGAERLEVRLGAADDDYQYVTLFVAVQRNTPGVELAGIPGEVSFFVPPGTIRLRVDVGAIPGPRCFSWVSGQRPPDETFEAVVGTANVLTLKLPPPADGGK